MCQSCFDAFKKTVDINNYTVTEIKDYKCLVQFGAGLKVEDVMFELQGVLERGSHLTGNFRIGDGTIAFETEKGVPNA